MEDEKNKTNINSFKKDNIYDLYLKTSNNQSCIDIKPNSKKFKEFNMDYDKFTSCEEYHVRHSYTESGFSDEPALIFKLPIHTSIISSVVDG